MPNFLWNELYFRQLTLTLKIFILIILQNLLIVYGQDSGHHHHGGGGGGLSRATSESVGHKYCKPPKFEPKNPNMPQQVHLALTNNPGEMNITWITFHDDYENSTNLSGVYTFVEYWKMDADAVEAKVSKRILLAKRIRHEYSDTIDIKCSKEEKPKNWNRMTANIRYIHTITLQELEDNKRYGYKVGYCVPEKIKIEETGEEEECICLSPQANRACRLEYRKKTFNFKMFPWKNPGNQPFTFLVFGDLGLRKPDKFHPDREKSSENSNKFDSLAPQSMQALVELVHGPWEWKDGKKVPKTPHRILKSHLNKNSSGLQMNEIQMILHIGDIAYDMHEWRMNEDGRDVYNLGDRFMHIIEDVAAYVPYMVVAGNHENEEKKSKRPDPPGAEAHFDPQYEHYESRFNMPRNYNGHNTNQFFHLQTGPFWIQFVSTEYYFSYSTPTWQWIPDYKRVQEQFDFTEYSLIKANMNRDKYPWVIVVQHRPFYCTSKNRFTCRDNKTHKNGIPDPDDASRLIYGLEELYNKYHVDLVITGHEHTFEMFPPIQLHKEKNRVIPYKYWWHARRNETHWMEENEAETQQKNWHMRNGAALIDGGIKLPLSKEKPINIDHEFISYIDPVAPINLIVGRPGNMEEMEKLSIVAHLQRVKQYNWFSFTLVHYPGSNAEIFVRQVDPQNGFVPIEFAIKKTFSTYDRETICNAIVDEVDEKKLFHKEQKSLFFMEDSGLIHAFESFTASEQYLRKRIPDPEEFSIHFLEEETLTIIDVIKMAKSDGRNIENVQFLINKENESKISQPKVLYGKTPKVVKERANERNQQNDRIREELKAPRKIEDKKERRKKIRELRSQIHLADEHELFTAEELDEIEGNVTNKVKKAKAENKIIMQNENNKKFIEAREMMSIKELKKKELEMLQKEVDLVASESSKLRALLHAFKMHKWKKGNGHYELLFAIAKTAVCKMQKSRRVFSRNEEIDEKQKIINKFIRQPRTKKLFKQFEYLPLTKFIQVEKKKTTKETETQEIVRIIWSQSELRAFANTIAFFYIMAFLGGKCPRAKIFHDDGTTDRLTGLRRISLLPDELQKMLNENIKNMKEPCFELDYAGWSPSIKYDSQPIDWAKITKPKEFSDMRTILKSKRPFYATMMDRIFIARNITLDSTKVGIRGNQKNGTAKLVVNPVVLLRKIQHHALDQKFWGKMVKWMVVDDPDLVDILIKQFLTN